jgi:MinD superfamily P-loop ATPase
MSIPVRAGKPQPDCSHITGSPRTLTIAIASGKGGTGKTTLAAHLAAHYATVMPTVLADLDVEAPDARTYFPSARADDNAETSSTGTELSTADDNAETSSTGTELSTADDNAETSSTGTELTQGTVLVMIPEADNARCPGCGLCTRLCRFGAIVAIGPSVTINPALCKGCGRCVRACPTGALTEQPLAIGKVERYQLDSLTLIQGILNIGDIRSTTVIEATKQVARNATMHCRSAEARQAAESNSSTHAGQTVASSRSAFASHAITHRRSAAASQAAAFNRSTAASRSMATSEPEISIIIRDCPPGVTCPTVRAVHGADLCILVAEPTHFSAHDLAAAMTMVQDLGIRAALVVNKAGTGTADLAALARQHGIPILSQIPWTKELAQAGARTKLCGASPDMAPALARITAAIDVLHAGGLPC